MLTKEEWIDRKEELEIIQEDYWEVIMIDQDWMDDIEEEINILCDNYDDYLYLCDKKITCVVLD